MFFFPLWLLFLIIVFDFLEGIWIVLIFSFYFTRDWWRDTIWMLRIAWYYRRGHYVYWVLRLGLVALIIVSPSFSLGASSNFNRTHSIFLGSQIKLINGLLNLNFTGLWYLGWWPLPLPPPLIESTLLAVVITWGCSILGLSVEFYGFFHILYLLIDITHTSWPSTTTSPWSDWC